jgi:glycosyltransferase involved in cell wall biosynthesis
LPRSSSGSEAEEAVRILYTIAGYGPEHLGGLIHREMALAMRARGHEYEIVVPVSRKPTALDSADPFEKGIVVHRLACGGHPALDLVNRVGNPVFRFPWFTTFTLRLARFLRSRPRFDVVIAEGAYPFGAMTWLATRRTGVPYVVSVAGGDFLANVTAGYGYARYGVPRRLMRRSFRGAAVVRAIAPYAGERAVALGCPTARLALVPRNISAATFLPEGVDRRPFREAARRRVAERFGLGSAALVVTVGRLLPIKGFDHLVRALPEIVRSRGDVRVLHVGPNREDPRLGNYKGHLEELATSLGVGRSLVFAGSLALEGVRETLAAADVAAVPSLEEGGNKTMIEAAAVGTPFVATRTSGNAGWAREWDCGLIVEPASADQLATAISSLLGDAGRANTLGENGLRFAEEFRTERVAERMLALCRVAASGTGLPPDLRQPEDLLHPRSRRVG